jgi:release factor glutamine methyltransferase
MLRSAGIERPRLEARLLLAHALGVTPEALVREPEAILDARVYERLVQRRAAREPLAHVLGEREFWSLRFAVSSATLIPRPETETLVEAALEAHPDRSRVRTVLDLGTGTGCLLLATLSEFGGAFGVGVDLAPAALALASRNAQTLGLADRAAFLCADWAAPLAGPFDLILSNPPYVATSAIEGLAPEVASFEPRRALDGGMDGLDAYRRIIPTLPRLLKPRGVAVLELGIGQAEQVSDLARRAGLATSVRPDLAGIPRALVVSERLP